MKRTGFKRLTYEEAMAKQKIAREKAMARREEKKLKPKRRDKTTGKIVRNKPDRIKTLKKKLWAIFSQYIRKSQADHTGYLTPVDAVNGERKHWSEVHCGHLIHNSERSQSLGGNELWYYEHNFAPQTVDGNYFNANDSAKVYTIWAVKKYGVEEVEKMIKMKEIPRKWTEEELVAKYNYYKSKFDEL